MPFLRRWAARYAGRGVEMDDLVQDAVVGLLRALERYEPDRGTPFLAFARWWVRQALQQAVAESSRPVRLPTHVLWDMHELKEARERLTRERGREPRAMELADALGWTADHMAEVLRAERPAEAIESADLVEYPLGGEAYERVLMRLTEQQIRPLILQLTARERDILAARGAGESLRTIGRRLGVSAERVRTIEGRALAKLRVSAAAGVDGGRRLLTRVGDVNTTDRKEDSNGHQSDPP